MTISRANVAEYLDDKFSGLAASIDQDSDPDIGYKSDIDDALRELGKTESELATATVEDGLRKAYFALSRYFAAHRIWTQLGARVNTSTGVTSYNFDGQRKQAKEIMEDAAKRCAALGYIVDDRVVATFRVY